MKKRSWTSLGCSVQHVIRRWVNVIKDASWASLNTYNTWFSLSIYRGCNPWSLFKDAQSMIYFSECVHVWAFLSLHICGRIFDTLEYKMSSKKAGCTGCYWDWDVQSFPWRAIHMKLQKHWVKLHMNQCNPWGLFKIHHPVYSRTFSVEAAYRRLAWTGFANLIQFR